MFIEGIAICTLCNGNVKNIGGTINLKIHLDRHHPRVTMKSKLGSFSLVTLTLSGHDSF